MLNPVRAQVDAVRQDAREKIPEELAKRFKKPLKREQWSRLHKGLARADVLALGRRETLQLIADPSQLGKKLAAEKERITKLGGTFAQDYFDQAEALAEFMVNRKTTSRHLLRNADAIARLRGRATRPDPKKVYDQLVDAIDRYVSLLAYGKLDEATRQTLKTLAGLHRRSRLRSHDIASAQAEAHRHISEGAPHESQDPAEDEASQLLPDWAADKAKTGELVAMQQLITRDGARTGNAVIAAISYNIGKFPYEEGTIFTVATDAGNILRLTFAELMEMFSPGEYIVNNFCNPRIDEQLMML